MKALETYDEGYETEWDEDVPVSEDGKALSEAEYWADYYEHPVFSYEWNNGYLEERPVSDYAGYLMFSWFVRLLGEYLTVHPIAKVVGMEFGFRMEISGKIVIRKPDLGVVLNSNPASLNLNDRSFHGIFDMCIEGLSDSSKREVERDTKVKKGEYQSAGVTEYYILDPNKNETAFFRHSKRGLYLAMRPIKDDLIQSQILPGFQFRISDLYSQTPFEQMADDPVYQSFVSPHYQKEKKKREQETQRADREKKRAEQEKKEKEQLEIALYQERQRAERLAEKLRALGISE